MNQVQRISILSKLGGIMRLIGEEGVWPGNKIGITEDEFKNLEDLIKQVHIYNGWFTEKSVREAFLGIGQWLQKEELTNWVKEYNTQQVNSKSVAIIMAGNIPLVGFHDFLAVFLSGNKAVVKLSSDDKHLFPAIITLLSLFDPEINNWVEIKENKLEILML